MVHHYPTATHVPANFVEPTRIPNVYRTRAHLARPTVLWTLFLMPLFLVNAMDVCLLRNNIPVKQTSVCSVEQRVIWPRVYWLILCVLHYLIVLENVLQMRIQFVPRDVLQWHHVFTRMVLVPAANHATALLLRFHRTVSDQVVLGRSVLWPVLLLHAPLQPDQALHVHTTQHVITIPQLPNVTGTTIMFTSPVLPALQTL